MSHQFEAVVVVHSLSCLVGNSPCKHATAHFCLLLPTDIWAASWCVLIPKIVRTPVRPCSLGLAGMSLASVVTATRLVAPLPSPRTVGERSWDSTGTSSPVRKGGHYDHVGFGDPFRKGASCTCRCTNVSAVTPGLACRLRAAPELPAGEGALLASPPHRKLVGARGSVRRGSLRSSKWWQRPQHVKSARPGARDLG